MQTIPVQIFPSPEYPAGHLHSYPSTRSIQRAIRLQSVSSVSHSLTRLGCKVMAVHTLPSPSNVGRHSHSKEPTVLIQFASGLQSSKPSAHSLIS